MVDKKPRIVLMSHSPGVGGAELAIINLINSTIEKYDWTVIVPSRGKFTESVDSSVKLKVINLPWWCYLENSPPPKIDKKIIEKRLLDLGQIIESCDIAITNTITVPWLAIAAKQTTTPHIWIIHEFGNIDHNLNFVTGYNRALSIINDTSDLIVTVSNAVKSHISGVIPEDNIKVLNQSIPSPNNIIGSDKKILLPNILMFGAIHEGKGQLKALEAFRQMSIDYNARIVGPISQQIYLEKIKKFIKTNSLNCEVITGFSPAEEQYKWADIVIISSENEALGRITLEALANGKIVFGQNSGATKNLLSENRGVLFTNSKDLTNKLNDLSTTLSKIAPVKNRMDFVKKNYGTLQETESFNKLVLATIKNNSKSAGHIDNLISVLEDSKLIISSNLLGSLTVRLKGFVPKPIKRVVKSILRNF